MRRHWEWARRRRSHPAGVALAPDQLAGKHRDEKRHHRRERLAQHRARDEVRDWPRERAEDLGADVPAGGEHEEERANEDEEERPIAATSRHARAATARVCRARAANVNERVAVAGLARVGWARRVPAPCPRPRAAATNTAAYAHRMGETEAMTTNAKHQRRLRARAPDSSAERRPPNEPCIRLDRRPALRHCHDGADSERVDAATTVSRLESPLVSCRR